MEEVVTRYNVDSVGGNRADKACGRGRYERRWMMGSQDHHILGSGYSHQGGLALAFAFCELFFSITEFLREGPGKTRRSFLHSS